MFDDLSRHCACTRGVGLTIATKSKHISSGLSNSKVKSHGQIAAIGEDHNTSGKTRWTEIVLIRAQSPLLWHCQKVTHNCSFYFWILHAVLAKDPVKRSQYQFQHLLHPIETVSPLHSATFVEYTHAPCEKVSTSVQSRWRNRVWHACVQHPSTWCNNQCFNWCWTDVETVWQGLDSFTAKVEQNYS